MTHSAKLKIEIIQKLELFSMAKLNKVLAYVKGLDADEDRRKRILSYSGVWKDLDKEVFDDLTTNLQSNRAKDIREF
ncbi:MAG: hypothetical protein R3B93_01240 [Bacteroidia bacterium]